MNGVRGGDTIPSFSSGKHDKQPVPVYQSNPTKPDSPVIISTIYCAIAGSTTLAGTSPAITMNSGQTGMEKRTGQDNPSRE
jgi:hypothetical protein